MPRIPLLLALASLLSSLTVQAQTRTLAASPPMGWNSWDAYGLTINESDFKANAAVLAGMKQLGWTYAVIDEGWYMGNPLVEGLKARDYLLDGHGLLIPVSSRFPSSAAGAGFRPLADWVHAQGLKFGIHIVRGIPKQAVSGNLPIADSAYSAADVADTADLCPWDDGNYGVRDNAAGQAYYDSMFKLYAGWGLDYIKVDCISDHPYVPSEIRQINLAITHSGRPIVLSLSPGPTQLSHAKEVASHAQLWRISNDIWDGWTFTYKNPKDEFPAGVVTAFDNLEKWAPYVKAGNWPDADMLPIGSLTPHPGWGEPRQSRLSQDEQRTQFALWAIARSPLILGSNLTRLDDFTRSVITNKDLIGINQRSTDSHSVANLPAGFEKARVWIATVGKGKSRQQFVAVFNLDDQPASLHAPWQQLGVMSAKTWASNIADPVVAAKSAGLNVTLAPHASVVYRIDTAAAR
jgi:alpha-galactosidase